MRTLKMCMTAFLLAGLAGTADAAPGVSAAAQGEMDFAEVYQKSVALLYGRDGQGGQRMRCTATAIERAGKVYRFVSAAHCLATDNHARERVEVESGSSWQLTFDQDPNKTVFYNAKIVAVGYQSRGDDFLVLEATIDDREVPLVPFAKRPARVLEPVINVASPNGLGKQVFTGLVSSAKLDRPVQDGDINWEGAVMLDINKNGGSSGSAVVSLEQKGIIAFLVGSIASTNTIALSTKNFHKFYAAVKAGKYKYWRPTSPDDTEEPRVCFYKTRPDGTFDYGDAYCRDAATPPSRSGSGSGSRRNSLPPPAAGPSTAPNAEKGPSTLERESDKAPLRTLDR